MPPHFSDSPNARSKSISQAEGIDTYGVLNRHPSQNLAFGIGVAEDKGTRRTMEDAHSFVVDFDSIRGQGFFAVFDGHAGKHAAEWCGAHFHEYLLDALHKNPTTSIPDTLDKTFHNVDDVLSRMCEESEGKIHSGCTAVTAFLRIEDGDGKQSFTTSPPSPASLPSGDSETPIPGRSVIQSSPTDSASASAQTTVADDSPHDSRHKTNDSTVQPIVPPATCKRVLYTANVGDARGVLCRAGKAARLTYDHKGTDQQEAKRITDAGGFVMSGRVNGVLAVTRSLGDTAMKDFVVGSPYTTETELCDEDEFLVLACDGLWDVVSDQAAIDLVREIDDAQHASTKLLKHALSQHTTDNVTVIVVRFKSITPRTA
ncbi:Protein phosphatase 2C 1 [Pleurotus ostreatus]|uniref:Protein phosphatase 2C 1 n=1 Tax=Pleurotus ostreatus TaxID=5322 RepID=A0A8H7DT84_PLEOS|nr:Protein phosphatase 2C 1 [Pleurotus ostreatus]KAF7428720.1 Protein phosphatase 2C 1 [Pleurotus ostreatus]